MKSCFLLAVFCGLVSCEKAREMAGRLSKPGRKPQAGASASTTAGSWVSSVPQGGYDAFRTQTGKLAVIDFYADWCGPCRKLAPILEKIANEQGGKILIGKINVDQNRELAASEGVRDIPDVRIFLNGREVDRFIGLPAENEVRRRLESHAHGLKAPASPAGEAKSATPQPSVEPMSKDWLPPGMQRR
jgi:thioredoxin